MSRRRPKLVSFEEYRIYAQPPSSEPRYILADSYTRKSFADYLLKKHPYVPFLVLMLTVWVLFQSSGMYPHAYLLEIVMIPFLPMMMKRTFGTFGLLTSVLVFGIGVALDDFLVGGDPAQRQIVNSFMILSFFIGFIIAVIDYAGKSHSNE